MVTYIAEWNKENEEKTWSGTTFALYNALLKKTEAVRVDANYDLLTRLLAKTLTMKNRFIENKKHNKANFDVDLWKIKRRFNSLKKVVDDNQNVIQIGDFSPILKSVIYQDLSFSVLKNFKEDDILTFNLSGFQDMLEGFFRERMLLQEKVYESSQGIACMSHWLMNDLQLTEGDKAFYAGAGINTPVISAKKRNRHQILFVGRDFKRKGGDVLVEAFKVIKREIKDASLILAGPNDLPEEIIRVNGIQVVGEISSQKTGDLMSQSAVMALPSHFEAFGLSFVEALSNGTPIIGRDKFEMPLFVRQGAGMILASSPDFDTEVRQLSQLLRQLLLDDRYLNEADAKKEKIQNYYNWNTVADRILQFFYS